MQWLRTHGALVILLLCTAVLFTDHLPEVITEFECNPSRYLDILQEPPM